MYYNEIRLKKLSILCKINIECRNIINKLVYDEIKLFDLLMIRMEKTPAFFDYTYEVLSKMMFEKRSIYQLYDEYQRLLQLNSLTEEFNNPEQWTKISQY